MNRIATLTLYAAALATFVACEGASGEGNGAGTDSGTGSAVAPYTIEVDKTSVEANGTDIVTFRVVDANGTNLSASESRYINIINETNGRRLDDHAHTWAAVKNGTFRFSATYKGTATENFVEVTAANRGKYETYFKKVAAMDITNTQCPNCPYMTTALENVPEEWQEHLEILAIHGPFNQDDPWILGNVGTRLLTRYIGSARYPSLIMNLDSSSVGVSSDQALASSEYTTMIEDQLRDHPATCGVAISDIKTEAGDNGSKIIVTAKIKSSTGDRYDLAYVCLLDGQQGLHYYQNTTLNDIVVAISPNYMSIDGTSAIVLQKDEEATDSYTFEFESNITNMISNLRILVYALRTEGDASIIDNLAVCSIMNTVGYKLNE